MAAAGVAASDDTGVCAVGSAAETLATDTSPIAAVTGGVATLKIGAVATASRVSSTFGAGVESFDAAGEVIVEFHGECVVTLVSKRDFPLGWDRGVAAAAEGSVRESFDVVSSAMDGAVKLVVDVVALLGEPPVLTDTLGAPEVVCAPADVKDPDDDRGVAIRAVPVSPGRLLDDESAEDPDDESDDGLDGSARASPWPESTAAPTPSVIITPANRPIPPPLPLTMAITHDNHLHGKRKRAGGIR